jgi:hypothetical protein
MAGSQCVILSLKKTRIVTTSRLGVLVDILQPLHEALAAPVTDFMIDDAAHQCKHMHNDEP